VETSPEFLGFWAFSKAVIFPRLWEGMSVTLQLTFLSGFFGIVLGLVLATMRLSSYKILRWTAIAHITLFRGTPLLLQILFIYFALPSLVDVKLDSFPSGILALSLNCAAYFAEIFRAAIESVSKGQMEAAWALGLSRLQALRRIIVPQTYKRLIPPVVNELAALTKDTSLVSVVALPELLYITQRIGAKYLRPWETYVWAALGYLVVVLVLSGLAHKLEQSLERKGGV
jgi:His/Glu/Gln/Arg/opine family amino acid ABC transporter permease subunit